MQTLSVSICITSDFITQFVMCDLLVFTLNKSTKITKKTKICHAIYTAETDKNIRVQLLFVEFM